MNRFTPNFDNPDIAFAVMNAYRETDYSSANVDFGGSARVYTADDKHILDSAPEALEFYLDSLHFDNA